MIIEEVNHTALVRSQGVLSTSKFDFAKNAHMFRLMSSGIYSDKITAVLREIGCNAYDAHISAGIAHVPFVVKLPTELDPEFYIQDFGPGLSNAAMFDLYTVYGMSDKQKNEEQTGAFGLGSKSPFAYTLENPDGSDGFTVESAHEGVKRVYTCYVTETGPDISLMYEGPVDESWKSGLKVTFAVQKSDAAEFAQKAKQVFSWFKVLPTVLGAEIERPKFEYTLGETHFSPKNSPFNGPSVVMANVRYPVNISRLRGVPRRAQRLLNTGIVLEVANGEVSVTPSREELEYTERTRNAVLKALLKRVSLVRKEITKAFLKDYPSKWAQVYETSLFLRRLPSQIRDSVTLFFASNSENKTKLNRIYSSASLDQIRMPGWAGGRDMSNAGIGCWRYSAPTGRAKKRLSKGQIVEGRISNQEAVVIPAKNTYAVYMDVLDTKIEARFLNYLRHKTDGVLFLIAGVADASLEEVKRYAEKLCSKEGIDGMPLKKLSDFELPPAPVRAPRARKPKQVVIKPGKNQLRILGVRSASRMEDIADIPETERYYVVKDSRSQVSYNITNTLTDDKGVEHYYQCKSGHIREAINACSVFLGEFGYQVEGVAVVNTEKQVKQFQLEKKGFKPLFGLAQAVLSDEQKFKRLKAGVRAYNETEVTAFNFGLLGQLAKHARARDALWKKFVSKFGATEIPLQVLQLLKVAEGSSAEDLRMRSYVKTLRSEVIGLQLPAGVDTFSTVSPAYDILQEFRESHKHLNVFNLDQVYTLAESQPDFFLSILEPILKHEPSQVTCAQAQA